MYQTYALTIFFGLSLSSHNIVVSNLVLYSVASLFPSNVRDRILQDEEAIEAESGAQTRLKNFLANDAVTSEADMVTKDGEGFATRPIADLFPDTTIMFADASKIFTS